ncbi:hypothetical protein [Streptomyces formicae]
MKPVSPTASAANEEVAAPDFYEIGHTYVSASDVTDWRFRVDMVTTHPLDGERTALGWRHFRGEWEPYAYGEDDWGVLLVSQIADATAPGTSPLAEDGGPR